MRKREKQQHSRSVYVYADGEQDRCRRVQMKTKTYSKISQTSSLTLSQYCALAGEKLR